MRLLSRISGENIIFWHIFLDSTLFHGIWVNSAPVSENSSNFAKIQRRRSSGKPQETTFFVCQSCYFGCLKNGLNCTFSSLGANWSCKGQCFQHKKKVPHWFPDTREPKVLPHPPKKWIFGPKTAKFGPKPTFLAKYRPFWPI